jgi:hypothetical protein
MKRMCAVAASFILVLTGCGLNNSKNDQYMGRSQPLVSVPEPGQDIDCDLIFP